MLHIVQNRAQQMQLKLVMKKAVPIVPMVVKINMIIPVRDQGSKQSLMNVEPETCYFWLLAIFL